MPDDSSVVLGPKLGQVNYANIGANFPNSLRALLRALDALVQASVLSVTLTAPPGSPNDGDAYIVAAGGTGAWAGNDGQLAVWSAEIATTDTNTKAPAWEFHAPKAGWLVFNSADGNFYLHSNSAWGQLQKFAAPVHIEAASGEDAIVFFDRTDTGGGAWIGIPGWDTHALHIYGPDSTNGSNDVIVASGASGTLTLYPGGTAALTVTSAKKTSCLGALNVASIAVYANNAAAITGGLVAGDFYRTGADPDTVCIVH